ncbi:GNAT family N-acetyltransferase [Nocardiopsis mangrovi]|uniref:GNAT family N-acetyltransferase n=1 Tax=Nocardiopsis mangrovi TaxID=1179818 RepID=A0ABV9E737_9ACTN
MFTIEENGEGGAPHGEVVVRAACEADVPAVARIYAHYALHTCVTFEEPAPDEADWGRRFAAVVDAGLPFLVAECGGEPVGYAYCSPWKARPAYRFTVENSIYLAPGAGRLGIGSALLGALLDAAEAAGVRQVIAVVATDAADAGLGAGSIALHRAWGFEDCGRLERVGYKHGRWLDTVLLQRATGVSADPSPPAGREASRTPAG